MADRQKMDPVDLWMWIGSAVCPILSGAVALFLFGVVRVSGGPGGTSAPSATAAPTPPAPARRRSAAEASRETDLAGPDPAPDPVPSAYAATADSRADARRASGRRCLGRNHLRSNRRGSHARREAPRANAATPLGAQSRQLSPRGPPGGLPAVRRAPAPRGGG